MKISSEAAGEISMTPVVAQEMPLRELLDVLLGVCGKDAARIGELLRRGSVMQSASRFRWTPFEADPDRLGAMLAQFPASDPTRRFDDAGCVHARLLGARAKFELPREIGAAKKLLRRRSFWDALMALAAAGDPVYVEYSYRERADVFRLAVAPGALDEAATLLTYSGLVDQVARGVITAVELMVRR